MNDIFEVKKIKLHALLEHIDVKKHADQQSGVFENSGLDLAQVMVVNGVIPAVLPIAYKLGDKLNIIRQSDVFNHLLAIFYPTEMGINVDRALVNLIPNKDYKCSGSDFMKTSRWLKLRNTAIDSGLSEKDLEEMEQTVGKFWSYEIPFIIYKNEDLALLAANCH